jgi:hypothetical protein
LAYLLLAFAILIIWLGGGATGFGILAVLIGSATPTGFWAELSRPGISTYAKDLINGGYLEIILGIIVTFLGIIGLWYSIRLLTSTKETIEKKSK